MSVDWEKVRLGDFCEKIGSGSTPKGGSSVYNDSGEISLIRSQNVYNDGFSPDGLVYIDENTALKLKNVEVEEDDILLNITGDSVARVCLAPKDYLPARVNQHVSIIRPNPLEFDNRFLRYFLSNQDQQQILLTLASSGATRNALTKGMIENLYVVKPDISTQKQIAKILGDLDDKIALNTQINQTLEAMAQALFKSWFVDFDPVKAKMKARARGGDDDEVRRAAMAVIGPQPSAPRPHAPQPPKGGVGPDEELAVFEKMNPEAYAQLAETADLFPEKMVESELGGIPEGWEVKPLSDTIHLIGGGTPKRSESSFWNGSIPWFSVKDVPAPGNVFVIDTVEKITDLGLAKSSTKILDEGITIITARGTVGKLALVATKMAMNQSCYGIKGIRPYFNYYNLLRCISILQQNTHGAVFDTITQKTFETVFTVIPQNMCVIAAFEKTVTPIMEQIRSNCYENVTLANTRDTLLPKLLSGEIDLSSFDD